MTVHVWTPPATGWGRANAGLVTGRDRSLLVGTLFDVPSTRDMLRALDGPARDAPITTVVNTHGDPDHWFGNQLLAGAEIIATEAAADEMRAADPGQAALSSLFDAFDFTTVVPTYPTLTFRHRMDLDVGGTAVELIEVGPAHTAGDLIVHVPSARTVFAGDLVFVDSTPMVWVGPIQRCVEACLLMLGLDIDVVVPGHGPVTTKDGVRTTIDYLRHVHEQAFRRWQAGMDVFDAAHDIDLGRFGRLAEPERLLANVFAVYRELGASLPDLAKPQLIDLMAKEPPCPTPASCHRQEPA